MIPIYDLWSFQRIVAGGSVDGVLQDVSSPFQQITRHLIDLPTNDRPIAFQGFLAGRDDRDQITQAMAAIDLHGSPPEFEPRKRPANLADLQKAMGQSQWLWEPWIASSRIGGIAAGEGVGKTRLAMDVSRRLWFGEPWPDGQTPTFPAGTPTLWACSDGQQDDLYEIAESWKMPHESLYFTAFPEDVYAGIDLDDPETLLMLEDFIGQVRPGLVFIDSLTFATTRDLCQANQVMTLMTPIRDLAQRTKTAIILLLHVSRDGQALGKRIKGIARTILQLECPDPERASRLRLSVIKSFAKKPPPLGVTMGDTSNQYDSNPPEPAGGVRTPGKPGRPGTEREEAIRFLRDSLTQNNDQPGTSLRDSWHEIACERAREAGKPVPGDTKKTFNRAVEDMKKDGDLTDSGGTGTGRQWTLHLADADDTPDFL